MVRCQRAHHLGNSCALQVQEGDPSHIFIRPVRHLPSRAIPAHVAGIARPSFSAFRPYCTQLKGLLPHSGLSRLAHILGVGAADVPLALLSGWLCCQGLLLFSKGSDQFQLLIPLLRCLARHILMPKAISAHACKALNCPSLENLLSIQTATIMRRMHASPHQCNAGGRTPLRAG